MAADTDEVSPRHDAGSSRRLEWVDRSLLVTIIGGIAAAFAAALVQVSFGTYSMTLVDAWRAVFDPAVWGNPGVLLSFFLGDAATQALGLSTQADLASETLIVWNIRLPRVFVAAFVGFNLAISGAIFQAVTRNELASPFILGVSSGAGLAILLTIVVFTGVAALLPLTAALGGAAAWLLVYLIAWKGGTSPVRLVLAGVIVAMVLDSMQTALFFFAEDVGTVQAAIAWTTGSLTGVDWEQVRIVAPWTVLIVLPSAIFGARYLNVLLLGERTASALGMRVERARFVLSAVAIVAAASSVAVAGIVSFVGLIVPHMVRTLVGSDHKRLLVGCAFVGPALLVVADTAARLSFELVFNSPTQLPVGIVTGLIGGPYFLYLMRKRKQLGEL
ncbi:iron ABC transporter permease [Natronomonas halophila]|uniref:FecCD family ABC transporter permease n=1 Tax=Natronomonas halophila TaxID=2747817 RepID=UPI0015B3D808|nr:iron ABC transporter permease [Natronomonas halophila]QLD85616.1 iron ABC transporter permease [Natronomonas halophila]